MTVSAPATGSKTVAIVCLDPTSPNSRPLTSVVIIEADPSLYAAPTAQILANGSSSPTPIAHNVPVASPLTANLWASPAHIGGGPGSCGGKVKIFWSSSSDATSCTVRSADNTMRWSGTNMPAGVDTLTLWQNTPFTITCTNGIQTASRSITVTLQSQLPTSGHLTFGTRDTWTGNLGGVVGADAKCQAAAVAANLRPTAQWRAMLSYKSGSTNVNMKDRIVISAPVYMVRGCGIKLADNANDFWTRQWAPPYGYCNNANEFGMPMNYYGYESYMPYPYSWPYYAVSAHQSGHGQHYWSGSNSSANSSSNNCNNWTNGSDDYSGAVGDLNEGTRSDRWNDDTDDCNARSHLMCISNAAP